MSGDAAALLTVQEHRSESYAARTFHNASVAALTVAFTMDCRTAGERLTAKAAGDRYVHLHLGDDLTFNARLLYRAWRPNAGQTLNVAGNGIYTLVRYEWSQERLNRYVYSVLELLNKHAPIGQIVSGGQTGVDIAGAVAGVALGIPTSVTLPAGFLQRHEDGADRRHTVDDIRHQVLAGVTTLNAMHVASAACPA